MYADQVDELRAALLQALGSAVCNQIQVKSADASQGQEADVVLLSTVRAGSRSGLGFLEDPRRVCVALTRAKCCLWIFGKKETLENNGSDVVNGILLWRDLLQDASARECVVHEVRV